jgi:hypothetical protein
MIEVFENGKLRLRLETTISYDDVMVLPKRIANACLMSADKFDELFYSILEANFPHAPAMTHKQAYEEAEKTHERYLGRRRYMDFDSFRKSRDQRIRK